MKCVILQPSYIPWRGYFHQIYKADIFVFYDDVQYDKNGWRNRNQIKTSQGTQWLTIPVHTKGSVIEKIPINRIEISWDKAWNESHWKAIQFAYRKAPFFSRYETFFSGVYARHPKYLSDFTIETTIEISRILGIEHTQFVNASSLKSISGEKTDHLISILKTIGADHYISGPSAKDYIEKEKFAHAGINLEYMEYNYPDYDQLFPPYNPNISIIDLLFMAGEHSLENIIRNDS